MSNPQDPFYGSRAARGPAQTAFAVTPADNQLLPAITSSLYVGTAGNLAVYLVGMPMGGLDPITGRTVSGPIIYSNVPAGTTLNISAKCVMATGTTASNIVGNV